MPKAIKSVEIIVQKKQIAVITHPNTLLLYDLISCQKTYQQKLGDSITSNLLYSTENSLFMGGKGEYALNI